jgi:hypothetical protein
VVTVWDDPEFLAATHHLDPWTTRSVLRSFVRVIQRARRVAVASDGMAELYQEKYHVRGQALIHGIHPSVWQPVRSAAAGTSTCVLGFAGSLHCKREWNALIGALGHWNRTQPCTVRVRFVGRIPRLGARAPSFVERVGPLPFRETLRALSECDAAYVPYWFAARRRMAARTAFPSKLSAYVAAGVPVMYHGPRESSPSIFLLRYKVGLSCHSLDRAEIQSTLRSLLFDPQLRQTIATEQTRALREQLGIEAMLRRFAEVLGIDRALLLPVSTGNETT